MLLFALLAAAFLAGCRRSDHGAANYPSRALNLIVPWAAGGGSDRLARFVADALHRQLGQPVIVVNRTGGSGAVGHSAGALAAPDGYTLTLATFELSTMRSMGISALSWEDFLPVAQINGDAAAFFVRRDAPWNNLGDLLDAIRREPGRLKMSGTATGGAWDLARSGLLLAAGIPPTNIIWAPAQGSAPALVELLGGHIDVVCCSVPEAAAQLEAGQVRLLAVLSPERLAEFPEGPTAREQGVTYDAVGWRGIVLPRATPPPVAAFLAEKLAVIAASDDFRRFMKKNGFAIVNRGPVEFAKFLRAEDARWSEVIRKAGYQTLGRNHDPGPGAMPVLLAVFLALALVIESVRSKREAVTPNLPRDVPSDSDAGVSPATAAVSAANHYGPDPRVGQPAPRGAVNDSGRMSGDAVFVVIALALYVAALSWAGFVASTLVFALAVMRRLGAGWMPAAIGSAVLVAAIHLLFVVLFKVPLP